MIAGAVCWQAYCHVVCGTGKVGRDAGSLVAGMQAANPLRITGGNATEIRRQAGRVGWRGHRASFNQICKIGNCNPAKCKLACNFLFHDGFIAKFTPVDIKILLQFHERAGLFEV
jgi:hypothetical protein